MCWKQEWAMAINNINHAIEHIEHAQKKLEIRLARNQKNLEYHKGKPKYNYPKLLAPIELLIKKNTEGIENCKNMVAEFRKAQALLYCMIHTVGIKHKETPERVYQLMGNYPRKNQLSFKQ